ncbi:condensation domain-containing protein, partial [Streptomyces sp. NPDC005122]
MPPDLPGTTPSARATRDAHGDPDAGGGDFAPLSFSQERLWLLAQLGGDASAAYNEPMAFDLRGSLEQKPLIRALDLLTARHEALRTRFVPVGATVRQVVDAPGAGFPLTVEDLTGLPDADERLAQAQREVFAVPFALGEETLARGRLIRLGAQHHVLLLTVHHVVFDGASRTLLLRELSEAYTSFIRGESPSLPEPTWSYGDYARWQRQWMEGEEPAAHAAYWTDALAGAPAVISLPTDRPRPVEQDFHGSRVRVDIDEDLTTALRALADKGGVSLFTALLAGWSALLSLLSGQDDIVVGTPSANRRRGDVGGLMGFLVNTLALRADVSDSQTVLELLDGVRRRLRSGLAHVDLPFDRVVESVNPPRSPAHTPLFQTMVAWVPPMRGELTLPGVEAEVRDSGYAPAKFDLALALCDEGERITGEIDYATALFDRVTVERYARYLLRVLRQMAECPDARIADVSLLDAHEQRELLEVFSDGGVLEVTDAAPRGSVLDRFAAQVSDRPAQAAVVDGHTTLDYATLDRRSNRLAHALISRGVRPGDVVGLHAGRSAQFVVGVLAVLKAGAAYLPLDPGQPDDHHDQHDAEQIA